MHRARSFASAFVFWGLIAAAAGFLAWDVSAALFPPSQHRAAGARLTVAAIDPGEGASADGLPALRRRFTEGRLPTRLVIPSAGVDTSVEEVGIVSVNGEPRWETSWGAAGHLITSALPGQPGNAVFTGHVSVADPRNTAVFAELDRVRPGDVIEVHAGATIYRYRVSEILVVDARATWVLRSQPTPTITLITCTKDLRARFVVRGELES